MTLNYEKNQSIYHKIMFLIHLKTLVIDIYIEEKVNQFTTSIMHDVYIN